MLFLSSLLLVSFEDEENLDTTEILMNPEFS